MTASTAGGSVTADFTLTVGSTTGGGGGGSTGIGGLSIVDGDGQFATENFLLQEPLTIQVKDAAGKPIPGQSVTFSVAQGLGTMQSNLANGTPIPNTTCQGLSCTSISDANGMAQAGMLAATVSPGFSYSQTIIAATNGSSTVNFTITTVQGQTAPTAQRLAPAEGVLINAPAGTIIKDAVQVRVFSSAGVQAGQPIANIGVKATTGNDPLLGPTATCVGGTVLTDSTGTANCSLLIGGKLGNAQITVLVGSSQQLGGAPINIRVTPGPPSKINLRQGNNQSGNPGATLPLAFLAEISDAYGNPLPGQTAQFEVVDAGSITLLNVITVADSNGRVSALGRLGSLPGAHQVRVRSGSITASFTFTVNVNVTVLQATTGSDQVANLNSPFGLPLTVRLLDDRNQPVTGASISWAVVTGTATLSAANSTTGTDGTASVTVSSGSVSGPVTVRAAYSNLATNFNLTVRIPGPVFTAGSITNAASGAPGVVPCGIANIFGSNFSKVSGVISAVGLAGGPLPTSYQGVEVLFDSNLAPIYAVANQNGQEQITVQVPCNLASPGTVSVTIRGTASTTVTGVQVNRVQPGIFETSDGPGQRRYAVLLRPDGSYVTNANPARRGDVLRMFVTGLGAVTPETATNRAGAGGQTVSAPLVVGVNDAGVRIVSSEYAVGMIGVYIVSFEIPSDTAGGTFRPLALAADPGTGNLTYGQGSSIANIQ